MVEKVENSWNGACLVKSVKAFKGDIKVQNT